MTHGAIIFAQNNLVVDYTKLAVYAASRIDKFLNIPVSIITDNKEWLLNNYPDHTFDQIIEIPFGGDYFQKNFHDGTLTSKTLEWKNLARGQVYELTPYDKTLVIDSDYILNSSLLKTAFDLDYDLQLYRNSFDVAGWRSTDEFKNINCYSIPFYWATAFVFQKNAITESFFNLIAYIKANWIYFRTLYSIEDSAYRNDYAFSIAIHIMNGKTTGEFVSELPGTMTYILDRDFLISADGDKMKFLIEKKDHLGEYTVAKTQGIDVHVMNKHSLLRFIDGGIGV
jgi:hypothetical protein